MKGLNWYISIFILTALYSCSGTKGLKPSDQLFTGTEVQFLDQENISDKNTLNRDIRLSYLKQNTPGLFNIKTWFYNWYDSTGTKGFKHAIKYKMGSEPVIFRKALVRQTENRLQNLLIGSGYLNSEVSCDSIGKKRKVKVVCEVLVNQRFKIDSVFYPSDTLPMTHTLRPMHSIDFLKHGDYLQRKNIIKDRDAFIETAHNNGFPFVSNEDVVFVVDTTVGNNLVDIHLQIRPSSDSTKYERYRYGDIYINPNFSLEYDLPLDTNNMIQKENYKISSGYSFLKEKSLNKAIYIKEGIIYNQSRSRITSKRLLDLGLFKFVNVKTKVNSNNTLDQFFDLTTYKMESITGEIELNNRQGNFLGAVGKVSYINKNLFQGAERFEISLAGGVETQFGDQQPFINTSDITLETSLTVPSIVLPFFSFKTFRNYIPKTFMSLGLNQQIRTGFYTVRSANAKYGFKWNESEYKSSLLVPLDLQWLFVPNTSTEFDSIIADDPRLELSFQNTFVLGWSYEYIYNKRNKFNPINQLYFKGTFESAGNILNGFKHLFYKNPSPTVWGIDFSQFVRLTTDIRKYWAMDVGSFASRFVVGTGFAFGNSTEVPYSKQYSVGGANDLRAFGLRRIGPGSFIPVDPENNINQFIDQTGDIKIELNLEYRFPILGYFKGALFVDAGNVWLYSNQNRPEGVFKFNNFYNEIAVGTGFGLRIDFDFFVLRFDTAFPLRNINNNGNFTWVVNDVNFFDSNWRSDNIVFNLGIGYPF
ncbi:MAG: BamA/TamA family outer membrane protein [Saprospiraceae bacterium]|nr:BamA/TamA family outer membrane protein [Saprospiraceae bacterium]